MRLSQIIRRAGDWFLVTDPGLQRLRSAITTTLGLALSLALLYALTSVTKQPITVALIGVEISMVVGISVNDPNAREQRITTLLVPVAAILSLTLGAFVGQINIVGDIVFVAVMTAATYARRFGPRWSALGMSAFMMYFFTLFLRVKPPQLPWLIIAVFIGAASGYALRYALLPDRPDLTLRRTLRALDLRVEAIITQAQAALEPDKVPEDRANELVMRARRLNETALMVESQFDQVDISALWPGHTQDDVSIALFDVELGAERLVNAIQRLARAGDEAPAALRQQATHLLDDIRLSLATGSNAPLQAVSSITSAALASWRAGRAYDAGDTSAPALPSADPGLDARRLISAIGNLADAVLRARATMRPGEATAAASDEAQQEAAPPAQANQPTPPPEWLDVNTRQALQVALASSLAIIAGELISPSRWYWSVITAYVVFVGATSRGHILYRGWQRLLGTLLGAIAGVFVAALAGGRSGPSLGLIFLCLFFGFYLFKVAYVYFIFFLTIVLALLYGLLGEFSVALLALRVAETVVGAVIGVVIAYIVLPIGTRSTTRRDIDAFLGSLGELVNHSVQRLTGAHDDERLIEEARGLDNQLQTVKSSAQPLLGGPTGLYGRSGIRHTMALLAACAYYARSLAGRARLLSAPTLEAPAQAAIVRATEQTTENIQRLREAIRDHRAPVAVRSASDLFAAADEAICDCLHGQRPLPDDPDTRVLVSALRDLQAIDDLIVGWARNLGAQPQQSDATVSVGAAASASGHDSSTPVSRAF